MTRWILLTIIAAATSGCERQVSIFEPTALGTAFSQQADGGNVAVTTPSVSGEQGPAFSDAADTLDNGGSANTSLTRRVSVRLSTPSLVNELRSLGQASPILLDEDGTEKAMTCCDNEQGYTAEVLVGADGVWSGTIQWQVPFGDSAVVITEAPSIVQSNAELQEDITPLQYSRNVDSDADGVDNLTELLLGTNPIDATDVSADFLSAAVRVPRVSMNQAPVIDGDAGAYAFGTTEFVGEWGNAVQVDVDGDRLSIGTLMLTATGNSIPAENHHWLAVHDGTWLYLLLIIDDAGLHHYDSQEPRKPWRDDSIEVFVDGDNSQLATYDNVDDFSMHITLLDSIAGGVNSSTNLTPKIFQSVNSVPLPNNVVFATGPKKGPSAPSGFASNGVAQDVYEIAIPIAELNIELGRTFGFEVQFSDDDDAEDRDAKWGWSHPAGTTSDNDFTWFDPRFMGRVVLMP